MLTAWDVVSAISPILWTAFLWQALRFQRFRWLPVFVLYAALRIPVDVNWAIWPTTPGAGLQHVITPLWMVVLTTIARCLITIEAVRWAAYPDMEHWRRWNIAALFGVGIACVLLGLVLMLRIKGMDVVGFFRIACFGVALGVAALFLLRAHLVVNFTLVHLILITALLGSSAFVSAIYRVDEKGHCIQGCRGDGYDAAAIAVQEACLLVWIRLFGSRRFVTTAKTSQAASTLFFGF